MDGGLTEATIRSAHGNELNVRYRNETRKIELAKDDVFTWDGK